MSSEFLKNKKIKSALIFLSAILFFNFLAATPAQAQAVIVTNPIAVLTDIGQGIKEGIGGALANSVSAAAGFFIDKLAYDAATWLASGDYNKGPTFVTDAKNYFTDAGNQAAGEAIAGMTDDPNSPFTKMLRKFGINTLCVAPDLNAQLIIKLNLLKEQKPPAARCDFRQIMQSYARIGTKDYWKNTGLAFQPGKNELDNFLQMGQTVDQIAVKEGQNTLADVQFGGAVKAPKGPIDNRTVTPAATVASEQAAQGGTAKSADTKAQAQTTGQLLSQGKISGAAANVGTLFLNTLAQKAMQKLMSKGFFSLVDLFHSDSSSRVYSGEAQAVSNRQAAEAAFADYLTVTTAELSQYPYLGDLASKCSENPNPYCGTVDSQMNTLLGNTLSGPPISVREALKQNLLNASWPLLPPSLPCASQAYCYTNLVKLRTFGILPVGWEIAAKFSAPDKPITLGEAVDRFYTPSTTVAPNDFYHLIDPNWLIKAPLAKCGAQVFGKQLIVEPTDTTSGQRGQYCADVQQCIAENNSGSCDAWGYCLQSRNIWKLGGTSCDKQFNTCTTYTNPSNGSASFLASTVDRGICDADNTGCKAYSSALSYDTASSGWQWNSTNPSYFNAKIEKCFASADGCTKFIRTAPGVTGDEIDMKKAPAALDCYGENLASTPNFFSSSSLPWPANKVDLQKIDEHYSALSPAGNEARQAKCQNYAGLCSAEEKGCELYSPTAGDRPGVPGVLSSNDLCPNECAGYETYTEQTANIKFASQSTNYFIPATAQACTAQYAGCTAFVNLEKQTQGGEVKEYYSDLRSCTKNSEEGATYYTWEGSDTVGYQLKSYTLKKQGGSGDTSNYVSLFGDGGSNGPLYNVADAGSLAGFAQKCTAALYNSRLQLGSNFNADCREFYDKDGAKYYRLYSHTVTVAPVDCQRLRMASADQNYCNATGGAWDVSGKICTFFAIPKEGISCPAEMNGCRAYKGNAGNNFQTIYNQDFENGKIGQDAKQLTGWDGKFSSESTVVGGKSLKVNNSTQLQFTVEKGKTLMIYFWAKGAAEKITWQTSLAFSNGATKTFNPDSFQLTPNWQTYSLGPLTVDWENSLSPTSTTTATLVVSGGATFFLDNIVGQQMTDNIYVIKDSWQTPSSCDNVVGDPVGASQGGSASAPYRLVPQAQVGCENYNTRQNQTVAVRNFSNLCRAEAVGCEEFIDTANTNTTSTTYVNLSCELTLKNKTNLPISCKDKNGDTQCSVAPNQKNCEFTYTGELTLGQTIITVGIPGTLINELTGGPSGEDIKLISETKIFPADHTVYLVNDKKDYCSSDNLGCSAFGPTKYALDGSGAPLASSTETVYLKANPEDFSKTLCQEKAVGCQTYTTSKGSETYFKDPSIKNQFCEYKNGEDISSVPGRSGTVSGWFRKDFGVCGTSLSVGLPLRWCQQDSDCSGGATCIAKGKMACQDDGTSGAYNLLPTRNDAGYQSFVGLCPPAQNNCSEFVDPQGAVTLENPLGQSYYLIDDEKLDKTSCHSQASLEKGCVLFNQTGKGNLIWNAGLTYGESAVKNYNLVDPINGQGNNANTILKVNRDRLCDQWLACKSSRIFDSGIGKEVCVDTAVCDQYQTSQSLTGQCAHWVNNSDRVDRLAVNKALTPSANEKVYTDRDVSFTGRDYTGYSWPDAYQINTLKVAVGSSGLPVLKDDNNKTINQSCRGYPVAEVPTLKGEVASSTVDFNELCSYTKAIYSGAGGTSQTKYYNYNESLSGVGVCDGGFDEDGSSKVGKQCSQTDDCGDDRVKTVKSAFDEPGVCLLTKKVSRLFGWQGYCLFADPATGVCAQWYPVKTPSNSISSDDLNSTAGYIPPEGSGRYWCVQAKGNANRLGGASNSSYSSYALLTRHEPSFFQDVSDWGTEVLTTGEVVNDPNPQRVCNYNEPCQMQIGNWSVSVSNGPLTSTETGINFSEIAAIGINPVDLYNNPEYPSEMMLLFPNQYLRGIKDGNDTQYNAGSGYYWSGPLKADANGSSHLDLTWRNGPNNTTEMLFNNLTKDFCQKVAVQSIEDDIGIRFIFGSTGKLTRIESKICDGFPSHGGFNVDLVFYLKEVCTDIRQVVKADVAAPMGIVSKARTDRIWQNSQYKVGGDLLTDPKLDLPYNQLSVPFGSFGKVNNPVDAAFAIFIGGIKSDFDRKAQAENFGFWPIWHNSDGATPFNCANENGGDCGKSYICDSSNPLAGSLAGKECKPDINKNYSNQCTVDVDQTKITAPSVDPNWISCAGSPLFWQIKIPDKNIFKTTISCSQGQTSPSDFYYCSGGGKDGQVFRMSDDAVTSSGAKNPEEYCYYSISDQALTLCPGAFNAQSFFSLCKDKLYFPCKESNNRGLCVGGQNHGFACGSAKDCPPKTYNDANNGIERAEYGTCVGAVLDEKNQVPATNPPARSIERLFELFTQWFGTWGWDNVNGTYKKYDPLDTRGNFDGDLSGAPRAYDSSADCKDYPNHSCNPKATIIPKPPQIKSLVKTFNKFTVNKKDTGDVLATGGNAILQFYAYADSDQMPLTRVAIDWGDGTPVNIVRGWFKNHKDKCGSLTTSLGKPCQPQAADCRVHFGDSSDACQEDFFTFRHIYDCTGPSDSKWNSVAGACIFEPKVQVLDNWGWCNSLDGKGVWNEEIVTIQIGDTGAHFNSCDPDLPKPDQWTKFNGTVIVKP